MPGKSCISTKNGRIVLFNIIEWYFHFCKNIFLIVEYTKTFTMPICWSWLSAFHTQGWWQEIPWLWQQRWQKQLPRWEGTGLSQYCSKMESFSVWDRQIYRMRTSQDIERTVCRESCPRYMLSVMEAGEKRWKGLPFLSSGHEPKFWLFDYWLS